MTYINNKEVAKYETNDYFIFFDRQIAQYGKWLFVNVQDGHTEVFNNKKDAFDFLKAYHTKNRNNNPDNYFIWVPENNYNIDKGAYTVTEIGRMIKFLSKMLTQESD